MFGLCGFVVNTTAGKITMQFVLISCLYIYFFLGPQAKFIINPKKPPEWLVQAHRDKKA